MQTAPLSPLLQQTLAAAQLLVDDGDPRDLPHAIEVCLKYHPDGPFTPREVELLRSHAQEETKAQG